MDKCDSTQDALLSVRIITVDYYLATPNPLMDDAVTQFSGPLTSPFKVPILRFFGVTKHGQKTCVHVHKAYPYFYIKYCGPPDLRNGKNSSSAGRSVLISVPARDYIRRLGLSLNSAISMSFGHPEKDSLRKEYIFSIQLVRGIPFYGFHATHEPFLKINLLYPKLANKIISILEEGVIMGLAFQPFEAHIPYIHQFFIDYNLYGMDFMHLVDGRFRFPVLAVNRAQAAHDGARNYVAEASINPQKRWDASTNVVRQSFCELEIDTWSSEIQNRALISERRGQPFANGRPSAVMENDTKLIPSLRAMWEEERQRREATKCSLPLSAKPSFANDRSSHVPWSNEPLIREQLTCILSGEKGPKTKEFGPAWLQEVPTAYQAIGSPMLSTAQFEGPNKRSELNLRDFIDLSKLTQGLMSEQV
ncbi:ribonuclease H-like domain-containing protein [Phlyctochytrium arcticum]|nr:ribonuclease H-like domain-containing protein [Phlyctochytrium arcticum]